jgi:hypothetical protein
MKRTAGLFYPAHKTDFCQLMQAVKQWIKKNFGHRIYRSQLSPARKKAMEDWIGQWQREKVTRLSDTSFDIFTYHGEDGIIQYLLSQLQQVPQNFADIGSGDCIKSNCATLALHYNWKGIFIDKDEAQLAVGKQFYSRQLKDAAGLRFIEAEVKTENINDLLEKAGLTGSVGVLSIDIDGNDFWIWKAIEKIQPEVVVVEAKVEFGLRSVAVPYGPSNHHSAEPLYNGASVEAFRKLGLSKGYKLAGANKQGYNLFFVKQETSLPETTAEDILTSKPVTDSFYPADFFNTHPFELI